jgi:hypothetical protein
MKILLGSPSTGKTKKILELSSTTGVPVLCESTARVERLIEKARGYGFSIPTPVTYDTLNPSIKEVYIDDLSAFVEKMLNVRVAAYTINNTDETEIVNLG